MHRLTESDVRHLVGVGYELGATATTLSDLPRMVVALAATLVGADHVALTEVALAEGRTSGYMEPVEAWVDEAGEAFAGLIEDHPIIAHYQRTGDGRARCISDFLTTEEFHAGRLYQQFYCRLGAQDQLAASFTAGNGVIIGLAFNRGARSFTERDRLVLDILGPKVAATHHRAAQLGWAGRLLESETFAEDEGVVVLDAQDRPLFSRGQPGALVEELLGSEQLRRLVRSLKRRPLGSGFVVLPVNRRYEVTLMRPALDGQQILTFRLLPPPALTEVLGRLGLTGRESQVLELLVDGASDREIGRTLGMSAGTVRAHIGHVMTKLKVTSRTAAVAVALRVLAGS